MPGVEEIIEQTVNETIAKLRISGLMRNDSLSPYEKTEKLLYRYNIFKNADEGNIQTKKIVENIDRALKMIKDDYYFDVIQMIFFDNLSREQAAEHMNTSVTTISRNKKRLVEALSVMLFSDEYIHNLIF